MVWNENDDGVVVDLCWFESESGRVRGGGYGLFLDGVRAIEISC